MNMDKTLKLLKACKTICQAHKEGGQDFTVVVGELLSKIDNPNVFEERAIKFFNDWFIEEVNND